ncbi:MAG TPA: TetR/AcrR family transcriptional regulator [Solirubrobacteraceae bacterium]|nr:TetR/AcrR family transcriptional regulator [Solirubrobacteraceae bacterium]
MPAPSIDQSMPEPYTGRPTPPPTTDPPAPRRSTDKPVRADARRNRQRLLTAAHDLFAHADTEVSLEAVGRAAGLGVGTVYRHFPTRDALFEAAYRSEVAQLCDAAGELLNERPADVALVEWMGRFVGFAASKRGLSAALGSVVSSGSDLHTRTRRQVLDALTTLLDAGVAAGTLRADVDAGDVLGAIGAIWRIPDAPDQARRILMLIADGLRHRPTG